jgi:hypothetical protein
LEETAVMPIVSSADDNDLQVVPAKGMPIKSSEVNDLEDVEVISKPNKLIQFLPQCLQPKRSESVDSVAAIWE